MIVADRPSYVRLMADRKIGLMLMKGYFEDSLQGRPTPTVMALSGFVAPEPKWEGFESEWQTGLLDRFGLPYFKMSPCLERRPRYPFADLTAGQRDEAAFIAMSIIGKYIDAGIGCAVVVPHFKALIKGASKKRHAFIRNHYSFCFFSVLEYLLRESEGKTTDDDKIGSFFDFGSLGKVGYNWERFKKTMDPKNRLRRVSFADDELLTPLQAADAVAHLSCKVLLCRQFPSYDPKGQLQEQCQRLLRPLPSQVKIEWYDRENLEPFMEEVKKKGWF